MSTRSLEMRDSSAKKDPAAFRFGPRFLANPDSLEKLSDEPEPEPEPDDDDFLLPNRPRSPSPPPPGRSREPVGPSSGSPSPKPKPNMCEYISRSYAICSSVSESWGLWLSVVTDKLS